MIKLEQIRIDTKIKGLLPNEVVTVKHSRMIGDQAMEVTFVDARGKPGTQLLYRDQESTLELMDSTRPLSFTASPDLFKLVAEAQRIRLGYLFDPFIAVNTSSVEPLPHQITAVYETMLNRQPLRFLLADDPGAGKTIMTGLLIKELIIRGDVGKCLIVAPGNLVEQWQDELDDKFSLYCDIMTNDAIEASRTGNWFQEHDFCICRLDKLSRDEDLQEKLKAIDWDLVIVDEAHKMSASYFGSEPKYTKRFRLGQLLSEHTRQFLLLTATPHNGKEEDFQLFMSLLDGDRFHGRIRDSVHTINCMDMMQRMVKEQLVTMEGKPLFPPRFAYTIQFALSDAEAKLYTQVTNYVREEFNRADKLENENRRGTVGFALTILQRRLASSPEAIYQSLRRRRERLEKRLREERLLKRGSEVQLGQFQEPDLSEDQIEDLEDGPEPEFEKAEETIIDLATTAMTISELEAEIQILKGLEILAGQVRRSGEDTKWKKLSETLQDNPEMFDATGNRRKLVIFTEQRDTLNYLVEKLTTVIGDPSKIVCIHGQTPRDRRRHIQESFTSDPQVLILVATDAAGEGINLQRSHLMINYDLPWNPNRLEQRFGRIHRIGQREPCHLWNLVAENTREGDVYLRLLSKLENERKALGGAVFDVLGQIFQNTSLKELLVKAIREGERPEVKLFLDKIIDKELDTEHFRELIAKRSLSEQNFGSVRIQAIREMMEKAEARKLQPHYIGSFFEEAFKHLGGQLLRREPDRFEIRHVPAEIRQRDRVLGRRAPILKSYERITFKKESIRASGKPPAALIAPGHPLLDSVIDLILEKHRDLLRQGAVLIDPSPEAKSQRVLLALESGISDGRPRPSGTSTMLSRQLQFVEITNDGKTMMAGYAPYLDYRPPTPQELEKITPIFDQAWLMDNLEQQALEYAVTRMVPQHLQEVRSRRELQIRRTMEAVHERLTKEIMYWNNRATELQKQEEAGKNRSRLNSSNARDRAERLAERLQKRMKDLEAEKQIAAHPPTILGGSLVIPVNFLTSSEEKIGQENSDFTKNTRESELLAMKAVMEYELSIGNTPQDVSAENRGYDIESRDPNLPAPRPNCFFVYVIECDDGSRYIGQTDDLRRRWEEHSKGQAAEWTAQHKPKRIAHYEEYKTREEAVKRERELKTGFGRKWLKDLIVSGRARQAGTGHLRFLEVKGRNPDANTVTVTKNEILTALNKPEAYWLVIVRVDGGRAEDPLYIKQPFTQEPEFATASVNFKLADLFQRAEKP